MAIRRFLLALVPAVALASACSPGEVSQSELDEHLCSHETVGDDFQELIRGNFTPRDLAGLAENSGEREDAYREAGMERGKFVYFKQTLPKPPFDPPINVVCQVIEFETNEDAKAWVDRLTADDALQAVSFGALPDDHRSAHSEDSARIDSTFPPLRYFVASGGSGEWRTTARYLIGAEGRFARLVSFGSRGTFVDDDVPIAFLRTLWLNRGAN